MQFQYISDIHLEFGKTYDIPPKASYLILAGDIGDPAEPVYFDFISQVSQKFKKVFLISGNHEYYSTTNRSMEKTEQLINAVTIQFANVYYLQNSAHHMENVSIFGTTLWSNIPPESRHHVKQGINDYIRIHDFTVDICNVLHKKSIEKFEEMAKVFPDKKWVVICHHLPQKHLIDEKYKHCSRVNDAFASNVSSFEDPRVVAVVYGHTHTPAVNGKYYCNPAGYPGENKHVDLEKTFTV